MQTYFLLLAPFCEKAPLELKVQKLAASQILATIDNKLQSQETAGVHAQRDTLPRIGRFEALIDDTVQSHVRRRRNDIWRRRENCGKQEALGARSWRIDGALGTSARKGGVHLSPSYQPAIMLASVHQTGYGL
jgi:hypothetical protein